MTTCPAALNIVGEHFDCDQDAPHPGLAHASRRGQAIWVDDRNEYRQEIDVQGPAVDQQIVFGATPLYRQAAVLAAEALLVRRWGTGQPAHPTPRALAEAVIDGLAALASTDGDEPTKPLPPEPPVGTEVLDARGTVWHRIDPDPFISAPGEQSWETWGAPPRRATWRALLEMAGPLRLLADPIEAP